MIVVWLMVITLTYAGSALGLTINGIFNPKPKVKVSKKSGVI